METRKYIYIKIIFLFGVILTTSISCQRDISDDAVLAGFSKNGDVFIDGFSSGLDYYPFGDSYFKAFSVDTETKYDGSAAMRFDIPNVGDPDGAYAGAIFRTATGRDLSGYDALTFWAKGTQGGTINEIGFGQDFGENKYQVSTSFQLTTNWRQYIIPIPDASKLTQETGMFWYAEGPEDGKGYSFWIDDLKFEKLGTLAHPMPSILNGADVSQQTFIGSATKLTGLTQTFNTASGHNQTVSAAPGYFAFTSSNPSVATVNELGEVSVVGTGTTVITATLGGVDARGSLTLESLGNFTAAPTPTQDPSNVISIFSDAYTNQPVEYYNGYWAPYQTTQGQNDITINNDNIIKYSQLNFVGIQFTKPTIDISQMTNFHVDIQVVGTIDPTDYIIVRLADIGPDNTFGTGDDSSGEVKLTSANLNANSWTSIDIPLASLTTLTGKSNLAQVVFVSDATITDIYVDNIYFYEVPTTPPTAAPSPTVPAGNVISIFSDAYTNVAGSDLNPNWGQATVVTQVPIEGNNTLKYAGLNYQGLQLGSSQDVSGMTYLHLDYYSANSTALNAYLISTGPVEKAKALSVPTASGWVSLEIPLTDFNPVNLADIIQFKFDGNGDIYLDNIYFHN
ncbi:hypothetical protein GCM10007962_06350 [Yeosuana aromativorans]|uniref:BIG2 domain-containing protein n=1 Tax=Yeosuana aromativorans TaxID=288019 RepID=A0A8J3FEN7_9FLAO|nr:Ig-like domain-containing protein [Yeosuana aromativorans]GGK14847.1 hypothetical protein GCM10007962_06350 [Yeosuana aromativorans]